MKRPKDVLVIGGGVIGVCTAYYLCQAGVPVTLVDKDDVCAGSSYGNAGLVVPSHAAPLAVPGVMGQAMTWLLDPASPFYIKPRPDLDLADWLRRFYAAANAPTVRRVTGHLLALNQASVRLYRELIAQEGLEFGYYEPGGLFLYTTDRGMEKGVAGAALLHDYGVEVVVLDAAAVRHMLPSTSAAVIGGVYYHGDAHLTPDRFVHNLADLVRRRGVEIRGGTEVIDLETVGDRVTRVVTTQGDLRPDHVVLATGAWAPTLGRRLGLRLPVQPAKGYSITVRRPAGFPEIHMHLAERKVAVTPMGESLRFAGTLELAGLDLSINRRRVKAISDAALQYLNMDPAQEPLEIWRGLRPLTPDSLPIVGPSPQHANLTVATGHGMLGISMGPITGKLVAQMVTGASPDLDTAALAVDRFR